MSLRMLAAAGVIAGALGGAIVAALVGLGGWGSSSTRTVVVETTDDTAAAQQVASPAPGRFNPARIYARRARGVVTVYSFFGPETTDGEASQGSGFVVSRQGHVLTNAHVVTTAPSQPVAAASSVVVEFSDGARARARIVGYDLFSDVGVLKVDPADHALDPVPLGSSSHLVVGQPVAVIGSPFGNQSTLTSGIVSATGRSISSLTSHYDVTDAIQTDAPINRGNSGGPLFDAAGRVIGINAQIRTDNGVSEGVGFAIPVDLARRVLRDLIASGKTDYAYLGVSTEDLTPEVARRLGYPVARGAVVACVESGSPAERAGLHAGGRKELVLGRRVVAGGDVIVGIAGHPVRSGDDLVRAVTQDLHAGRSAVFTVVRDGRRKRIAVRLAVRPRIPSGSCGG